MALLVFVRLLLLATVATLPVAFYADAKEIAVITQVPWLDWTNVIALAFMVGAVWEIGTLRWSLRNKPKLIVQDRIEPDDQKGEDGGYLRIDNDGEFCQIQATGEILGGVTENRRLNNVWPIPWRFTSGQSVPLEKGGSLVLSLQAQMLLHADSESEYEYLLRFEHFSGNAVVHASTGWSPTQEFPYCGIRIRITSTPSIAGKVLPRDYEVGLAEDGKLIWRPYIHKTPPVEKPWWRWSG